MQWQPLRRQFASFRLDLGKSGVSLFLFLSVVDLIARTRGEPSKYEHSSPFLTLCALLFPQLLESPARVAEEVVRCTSP